jgi:hypothetical protein
MFYHDGTPYYAGGVETPCDSNLTSYRQSRILDTVCETWTDFPTTMDSNDIPGAAAVMFAPGRILKAGGPLTFNPNGCVQGNLPITTATNRVRRINLAVDSGGWAAAAPMAIEREWLSLVCLPSGRILAVGGPANSHPEMYDPNADTWAQMALMVDKRAHHAVGLLCQDGSVYVAGGEYSVLEPEGRTYRIYKPPYFFQGTRPSITSIPDVIQYGTPFTVGVTTTNPITKVRLVRPGAITHSFDQNARIMELSFAVQSTTSIRVAAPVNQQFAPPGYYMVFVCEDSVSGDGGGLPSEGKFVKLELPDS